MHHIFRISEILSEVFGHLDSNHLARSARVCRAWFIPAIELLWQDLEHWDYLLQVLSEVVFTEEGWVC